MAWAGGSGEGGRLARPEPARGQCAPAPVRHSTSARQRNHTANIYDHYLIGKIIGQCSQKPTETVARVGLKCQSVRTPWVPVTRPSVAVPLCSCAIVSLSRSVSVYSYDLACTLVSDCSDKQWSLSGNIGTAARKSNIILLTNPKMYSFEYKRSFSFKTFY